MKKVILALVFILCQISALGAVSLDIDVSGGLDFGYMVIPDSGTNTSTSPANSSSVRVSFISSEPGDTVSVSFSGTNVNGDNFSGGVLLLMFDFSESYNHYM